MPTSHLTVAAKAALKLSDADRINYIRRRRWIEYEKAMEILAMLEDLLTYPKTHRMPAILIYGPGNNGKTMLIARFCKLHPGSDNPDGDAITLPVLAVQAPPGPDESRFYEYILEALHAPYKRFDKASTKYLQILTILRKIVTKELIIDEIHNILAGSYKKHRYFLNVIKSFSNDLQMIIAAAGTYEALSALSADPQLYSRFARVELPKWTAGTAYDSLLSSFESTLPLKKPSNLVKADLASIILSGSEGLIGNIAAIVTESAVKAVQDKTERITAEILKSVVSKRAATGLGSEPNG